MISPIAISIRIIDHKDQRYDTAGDYIELGDEWFITLSKTNDWRYWFLVLIHELVEMGLTKNDNIDWDKIDLFDMIGDGSESDDPGSLENAPYHEQHKKAEQVEKMVAKFLGVDWQEYSDALDALEYKE